MPIYHALGHFLYYYSPAIQAVCAILALIDLAVYAFDTRAIRVATLAQSDASRRPFLDLITNDFSYIGNQAFSLKNNGVGPAISVAWAPVGLEDAALLHVGALSVGAKVDFGGAFNNLDEEGFNEHGGVAIVYSDTAGRDYVQLFVLRDDASVRNVILSKDSPRNDASEAARYRVGKDRTWQARYLGSDTPNT